MSMDKLLENLRKYLMVAKYRIEYIFKSPVNRSTLKGVGVAGCIGLIGFLLRLWFWTSGIVVCLLGGFIGSGIYKSSEMSRDELNSVSEVW